MWRETTKHERNRTIWAEELDSFVPQRVLDFHTHVYNAATIGSEKPFSCGGYEINGYTFEDLTQDLAEVFPGRETAAVCFGMPFPQYDEAENNRYVAQGCDNQTRFALRLIDPAESPEDVKRDVLSSGFLGLKPYLDYVKKADLNQVEIHEMLPEGIMRLADELGLIVMLHIPRKGRLADPLNQRQIVELCTRYPRAKIILAHIGRAYYLKNIVGQLDRLKDLPNLYYDTAMLNHAEVIEYLFETVAPDRVLYASDMPISLAAGKSVEINNQYTYITPVPWELAICDTTHKLVFTSFLYEELRAIKTAVTRLNLPESFVEDFFYHNGMRLLQMDRPYPIR